MNRSQYDNVPLYDKDAVRLLPCSGVSDFVHASKVITSGGEGGYYIIAQTPLVNPSKPRIDTQYNWLRMLWEFNVYVAVCLVNLGHESECDYYFNRSRGETYKVNNFEITTLDVGTDVNWCWTYYRLKISRKEGKKRYERVIQLVVCVYFWPSYVWEAHSNAKPEPGCEGLQKSEKCSLRYSESPIAVSSSS
nr:unnamed protein product [Meloidogyne enterolobii]CAD2195455.1 unnamed protein product [Meloidogyne enterolobii]